MAFPPRIQLGDVPFRFLLNFFSAVQSLSIILDNSEKTGRVVLGELGFESTQINYLFVRYKRPVAEALLLSWKGTVHDLYRVLLKTAQSEALLQFYTHLSESEFNNFASFSLKDIHDQRISPRALTEEDWRSILQSTNYRISTTVSRPEVFFRTYIIPIHKRVRELVTMICPINTIYAPDMYRAISNLMNNITTIIWLLTLAQNTLNILTEGRLLNLVTILISLSLWIKLYLMNEPFNQLKDLMPVGDDKEKIRRADFLYKEVRIALLFVFFFKLALTVLGSVLFYAYPQFFLEDLQSQMTQFVVFLFCFELIHNAFYLISFYRHPNIFRVIHDLFPE